MKVFASGRTHAGRIRRKNEDHFGINDELKVFVVADGMGGHKHGEVASAIAVRAVEEFIGETAGEDVEQPFVAEEGLTPSAGRLKTGLQVAHDKVLRAIETDDSLRGMGTTMVAMLVDGDGAAIAHVGDSRAYLLRGGRMSRVTHDHTWVNEQVAAGHLSEEQARLHPLKNVVTRALGGAAAVEVDVQDVQLEPGDMYLLCSDGLIAMLSDDEIAAELSAPRSLDESCDVLIARANERGGVDNITVVLVATEEEPAGAAVASASVETENS